MQANQRKGNVRVSIRRPRRISMSYSSDPLSPPPIYPGTKPRFHAMVKPTGAICNLDCTYCYYLHKEELLGSQSRFRISDEVLEAHVRQYIEAQRGDEVVFSWQG